MHKRETLGQLASRINTELREKYLTKEQQKDIAKLEKWFALPAYEGTANA